MNISALIAPDVSGVLASRGTPETRRVRRDTRLPHTELARGSHSSAPVRPGALSSCRSTSPETRCCSPSRPRRRRFFPQATSDGPSRTARALYGVGGAAPRRPPRPTPRRLSGRARARKSADADRAPPPARSSNDVDNVLVNYFTRLRALKETLGQIAETDLDYLEVSEVRARRRLLESAAVFGACPDASQLTPRHSESEAGVLRLASVAGDPVLSSDPRRPR